MINGHGDDAYQYAEKVKYNFSSNVYFKGTHIDLLKHIQNNAHVVGNYPSPVANELNKAAADFFQLEPNQFLFGNGATELFYLIAQHFSGKTATIIAPTFSEYEDACKMFDIDISWLDWRNLEDFTITSDLFFICNPNNPTGTILEVSTIASLLEKYPKTVFVIDEAYTEFTVQDYSSMRLLHQFDNLIIVKSLTKSFAIPGLRLGYLVSNKKWINILLNYKLPWTVNAIAIQAGLYIFSHYHRLLFDKQDLLYQTQKFQEALNAIPYLQVQNGETSYFLVKIAKGTSSVLKAYLMQQHQILVRDAGNFTNINGEFIRLSVQEPKANNALIKALKQWS